MTEFRPMRRKRQQMSDAECIDVLTHASSGVLAVLGDEGYPYAVPLSYVYHEGRLIFHSAVAGHKVDAMRNCDKASFCVVQRDDVQESTFTTLFRSVIVFGRISLVTDEDVKRIIEVIKLNVNTI